MNTIKLSAWLGIVLSLVDIVLKIVRVMRQTEWWLWIGFDYIAAAILLIGAIAVLRGRMSGRWLAAGWGFSVAMFYGSFAAHLESWVKHQGGEVGFDHLMVLAIGPLFALNILGLALALWYERDPAPV